LNIEEKLALAKKGSRTAYDALCVRFTDKLYTAALVSLKNRSGAEQAVIDAVDDGFKGIARIKDERHLCSWLVHELTKVVVDTLKEYKAAGTVHNVSGELADIGKMPDVERLIFAVSATFGYSDREISVLLGMPENIVADKLSSAKNHLGSGYDKVLRAIASTAAPASLLTRFSDAGVQEEHSLADVLNIGGADSGAQNDAGETNTADAAESDGPYVPEVASSIYEETMELEIGAEDAGNSETAEEEPAAEEKAVPESIQPVQADEEESDTAGKPEVQEQNEPETVEAAEYDLREESAPEEEENSSLPEKTAPAEQPEMQEPQEEESVFAEENESEDTDAVSESEAENDEYSGEDAEADEEQEDELSGYKLDAETFIAVVSAERMKGSEFLRLIGNTRISNSAFREIEQNPKLTKKRLIELLEQSPLTENDYYKMLTAIRDRREVLDAKEENRLALEKAGLYDGSRRRKRRRRTPPKTELQMAIGMSSSSSTAPLTFNQQNAEPVPEQTEQYRPGFEKPPVPVQPSPDLMPVSPVQLSVPVQPEVPAEPIVSVPEEKVQDTGYSPEERDKSRSKNRNRRKNGSKKNASETEEPAVSHIPPSLGDIVSDVPRKEAAPIFSDDYSDDDDPYGEAVDPFAAIAANEIGAQSKPERLTPSGTADEESEQKTVEAEESIASEAVSEKPDTADEPEREEAEPAPAEEVQAEPETSENNEPAEDKPAEQTTHGTIEFAMPLTSVSDTKTFDKIIPIPFADEIPAVSEVPEKAPEPVKPAEKPADSWVKPIEAVRTEEPEDEVQPFRVEIAGDNSYSDDEPDYDDYDSKKELSDAEDEPAIEEEPASEEQPVSVTAEEPVLTETAEQEVAEPENEETEPEEPIQTSKPRPDLSVTQIISDYAIGESNPYVNDIIDPEGDGIYGYKPDLDLVFESGKNRHGKAEVLEFTSELVLDKDTSEDDDDEEDESTGGIELHEEVREADTSESELSIALPEDDGSDDEAELPESSVKFTVDDFDEPEDSDEAEEIEDIIADTAVGHRSRIIEEPEDEPDYERNDEPEEEPEDESDDEPEEDAGKGRYKGNEFFYDDDRYYEGVNNGKIIACAVCAVLLTAGSVGMKFMAKPADTAPAEVPAITEEAVSAGETAAEEEPVQADTAFSDKAALTKLSSYSDLTDAKYSGSYRSSKRSAEAGYMRASGAPYAPQILPGTEAGVITDKDTAYIYTNDYFRKVSLAASGDTPAVQPDPVRVDGSAVYGYTVLDGDLYVISDIRDASGASLHETAVTVYDSTLSKKEEYSVTGDYAGAVISGGKLVIAAVYAPDKADSLYSGKKPSFSKNGSVSEIPASDIYAIDGAKHNALHIIYTAGGNAAAVLGGYTDSYSSPSRLRADDDGITLVTVDEGVTYAVNIAEDMTVKGADCYMGEAFGTDCLGYGAMIGQLPDNGGITAYKNGTYISTLPEGESGTDENARSIAWSDNGVAFVVAEQGKTARLLYGFDMSGDVPAPADVTSDYIYSDRLSEAGDLLAGLKAEPTPDGERAGLRLSLYRYDGGLKETAYSIIELDKDTSRDNLKYLSSPAESNSSFIAVDETGTMFAVPTVYFDGFSEVERIVVLRFDGSVFTQIGEHLMYDEKSSVLCPVFYGGNLYIITDSKLVTLALPSES